jgi:prepilin-type N-terminal cleavage/methylation domain-containing protein
VKNDGLKQSIASTPGQSAAPPRLPSEPSRDAEKGQDSMTRRLSRLARSRRGFTMLELLTTLIIILVLVGILLPTVKKMREKSQEAAVKAQISSLDSAIARYQQDFHAFPGPLPRSRLYPTDTASLPAAEKVFDKATGTAMRNISGAENLLLGLMGGLVPNPAGGFDFDVKLLGRGPRNLHPSNPKSYTAYIEGMILSEGHYKDGSGEADDSPIPEIMDRFNNSLPIIYARAQVGAKCVVSVEGRDTASNSIIGNDTAGDPIPTQYDIREIISYTGLSKGSIGEGKNISASEYKNAGTIPANTLPHGLRTVDEAATTDKGNATNYKYPYDAFPYFNNATIPPTDPTVGGGMGKGPNATGTPRNKDRFILISAGVDRVYGTPDDITNAGSVLE